MSESASISIVSVEEARPASPYRRILVPIDGGELAAAAADQALALAASTGAAVVFLTITRPFHLFTTSTEMIEATREEYERQSEAHADQNSRKGGRRRIQGRRSVHHGAQVERRSVHRDHRRRA